MDDEPCQISIFPILPLLPFLFNFEVQLLSNVIMRNGGKKKPIK